jgi:hypothetical protein
MRMILPTNQLSGHPGAVQPRPLRRPRPLPPTRKHGHSGLTKHRSVCACSPTTASRETYGTVGRDSYGPSVELRVWGPEEYSAAAAVGGLVVAVVVAAFAAVQVLQARKLREEQARPYVVVDFEFRGRLAQIAIFNIGATPARDIRISFDKPLVTVSEGRPNLNEATIFTSPIPMMAPGRKILIALDSATALFEDGSVPLSYEATVTYLDHRHKRQEETYQLDLSPFLHTPVPPDGIPEMARAVRELKNDFHRVVSHGHVRVKSSDLDADIRWQDREYLRRKGRKVRSEKGVAAWVRWRLREILRRRGWDLG